MSKPMAANPDLTLPLGSHPSSIIPTPPPEPSVALMLQQVIEGGITADSVGTLERMIALYERMEDKKAEREFSSAFSQLQAALPKIQATQAVPDRHGNIKYHYAPYSEIMAIAQPFLTQFGFGVSFDSSFDQGRITAICKMTHSGGHSEKTSFGVRIGAGPHGSNEPQADMAARLVAMRGALCSALNIAISHDDDARNIGTPISAEKAEELRRRVRNLESADEAKFLKWCGGGKMIEFEEISSLKLEAAETFLDSKEALERKARE